ncbi:MAG: hypothetical protein IJ576_03640 [Synergistaceae bacterium]|nr:hypothetical protein [Synergistaceae bacterium]MBR1603404.1 hypothetical protein [Synergistaceae bacterium]
MAATKINVHNVTDSINNANKQIAEQERALSNIEKNINSMQGVWEAEDQKAYAERFKVRKQKIDDFNIALSEYLKAMQKYVDDCAAADEQTGRDLSGISW